MRFLIGLGKALVVKLAFRHVETGAVLELRLTPRGNHGRGDRDPRSEQTRRGPEQRVPIAEGGRGGPAAVCSHGTRIGDAILWDLGVRPDPDGAGRGGTPRHSGCRTSGKEQATIRRGGERGNPGRRGGGRGGLHLLDLDPGRGDAVVVRRGTLRPEARAGTTPGCTFKPQRTKRGGEGETEAGVPD